MKQRIRVVGLIQNENGTLVFKRSRSRSEAPVFWELLTGKIKLGEQPEEAMARALEEYAEVSPESVKLKDVITFINIENSSRLSNLYIVFDVRLPAEQKIKPVFRYSGYKYIKDLKSSGVHLDEASASVIEIELTGSRKQKNISRSTANAATVYVDGASRGNPGPSGIGYCVYDETGKVLKQGGEFIGFATSRVAEYYAMREGLETALELGLKSVRCVSDSLMVVNQLQGTYSVKNRDIIPIYNDILKLINKFENVDFVQMPREKNLIADHEANAAIDDLMNPVV